MTHAADSGIGPQMSVCLLSSAEWHAVSGWPVRGIVRNEICNNCMAELLLISGSQTVWNRNEYHINNLPWCTLLFTAPKSNIYAYHYMYSYWEVKQALCKILCSNSSTYSMSSTPCFHSGSFWLKGGVTLLCATQKDVWIKYLHAFRCLMAKVKRSHCKLHDRTEEQHM